MIYNKSTHPVEVKKISVRLWALRDEIEAAIGRRMKECEAAGVPLYIDDIKRFYNLNLETPLTSQENVLQLHPKVPEDGMASLMETISEDAKSDAEAPKEEVKAEGESTPETPGENKTFTEAEAIIAKETQAGLENKKPNPILDRPYERQAPDLDKVSYGFTLLSDLTMESVLSFTKNSFLQGQSVVVEFLIPQNFMMTAQVLYCHHYALRSRIISSTKPDYRLQCRYSFSIPGERDTLRSFLKSIEPNVPMPKRAKKESEEDSLGL